jgi:hypothetical protein
MFSERELKRLEEIDLHNWIHIDKFMEGKHIVFKRAVTAYLIEQLAVEYREVFNRVERVGDISTDLHKKMEELIKYKRTYYLGGDSSLYEAIVKVAQDNNLFDLSIYSVYNDVKELFEKLPFLKPVFAACSMYNGTGKAMNDVICDLFKYYKQRIDWKHYNIRLNEDVVTPMVDLNVEELA